MTGLAARSDARPRRGAAAPHRPTSSWPRPDARPVSRSRCTSSTSTAPSSCGWPVPRTSPPIWRRRPRSARRSCPKASRATAPAASTPARVHPRTALAARPRHRPLAVHRHSGRRPRRHRQAGRRRARARERLHRRHRGAHGAKPPTPAAEIQQNLFPPRIARVTGAQVAGGLLPTYEVGGDWFDFVENRDGAWLAIGDAPGNGPTAAGLGAAALGALRAARRSGQRSARGALMDGRDRPPPPDRPRGPGARRTLAGRDRDVLLCRLRACAAYVASLEATWSRSTARPTRPLGRGEAERVFTTRRRLLPGERVIFVTDGITGPEDRVRRLRRRRHPGCARPGRGTDRRRHRDGDPERCDEQLARTARRRRNRRRSLGRLAPTPAAGAPDLPGASGNRPLEPATEWRRPGETRRAQFRPRNPWGSLAAISAPSGRDSDRLCRPARRPRWR